MLDKEDLQAIAALIRESEQKMMSYIENTVAKDVKTVAEGVLDIQRKLPDIEKLEDTQNRVSSLERIVEGHRNEIDKLKKAQ